jgi:hypothetical protein
MKKIQLFLVPVFLIISISAYTAENKIKTYGNLYTFFGYNQSEVYDSGQKSSTDRDTSYSINDNSNLGFQFKYAKYNGVFELGISDIEDGRQVKIRKAYGEFNTGFGKLLIGQTWNPYIQFSNESADYFRSKGFGSLYEEPTTQLKFETNFGLYFDVIKPYVLTDKYYTDQEVDNPESSSDASNIEYRIITVEREITTKQPLENIQSMVPKIVMGYNYEKKGKGIRIKLNTGVAGAAYKIKKTEEIEFNKSWIISYLGYLNSEFEYDSFILNVSGGYSVNPANFGITVASEGNSTYHGGAALSLYNIATDKWEIKDTWNAQSYIEMGYKISSDYKFFIGYGFSLVDYPVVNTEKDFAMEYYANLKISLGNLIALTPSVAYRDYMKDMTGNKEGYDICAGILATISFQ